MCILFCVMEWKSIMYHVLCNGMEVYYVHLDLITGVLRHFLYWGIFVGGRNVKNYINYKKVLTPQKRVTMPLFYCCMFA